MDALIANARFHFHKQLFETNTLTLTSAGVASTPIQVAGDPRRFPVELLIFW